MVQLSLKMEKDNIPRTKIVTYWILDPEDERRRSTARHVRKWSKYSAIAALLVAVCGLVATTFVWSKYGLSVWTSESKDGEGGRTPILVLHILGPLFLLVGVVCFVVACVLHEVRGRDNSNLVFDPGALDAV